MYTLIHDSAYFTLESFRYRRPGRRGKGHMRWIIRVNRFAVIIDDKDLDLVYSTLHPDNQPYGYGYERVFNNLPDAEHMFTILLLKCS